MAVTIVNQRRNILKPAAGYLLAIAAVEAVTMFPLPLLGVVGHTGFSFPLLGIVGYTEFSHPLWGVIGHASILAAVIINAARSNEQVYRQLVLSLALVPLIRIVDLTMAFVPVAPMWRWLIVYAPLLVATIVVMRFLGYSKPEVGLRVTLPPAQFGIAMSGFLLGWVEYLILKPEAMVTQFTWVEVAPLAVILAATTGFVEEFTFRGVFQRSAVEALGGWPGIAYVSSLFAIMHMGFHSWIDVVFVFGVAMFFGGMVKKTGSLLGVVIAHGITNIMLFLVCPFFF
ncbi:MAG: CPBP family intramembrane metalloprotease [Dehalococcoidales bacterium]|nr:CPBP family intramembrane metalloprotease [Dehalococcoidales bacterium]